MTTNLDFTQLEKLTDTEINDTVLKLKKELFDLRLQKATRQELKPHLFKQKKKLIAKLLTIKSKKS